MNASNTHNSGALKQESSGKLDMNIEAQVASPETSVVSTESQSPESTPNTFPNNYTNSELRKGSETDGVAIQNLRPPAKEFVDNNSPTLKLLEPGTYNTPLAQAVQSGYVFPYSYHPHSIAVPHLGLSPEAIKGFSPEMVLWAVSHYFSGSLAKIPPFRDESQDSWRALMVKNFPTQATQADVLRHLKPAGLECIKRSSEHGGYSNSQQMRSGRFELRFIDFISALTFYAESMLSPIILNGEVIECDWTPAPPMKSDVADTVKRKCATRSLHVRCRVCDIPYHSSTMRSQLRRTFGRFGVIESLSPGINEQSEEQPSREVDTSGQVKGPATGEANKKSHSYVTWVVTFIDIESSIAAKRNYENLRGSSQQYPYESIQFSRDTNIRLPSLKKQAALLYLGESPYNWQYISQYSPKLLQKALAYQSFAAVLLGSLCGDHTNIGNRCICLSRLPPQTKLQDICNTVRGGMLESVKLVADRHAAFVTFLEPTAAAQFWATYQSRRLSINSEWVRVGWGRHSGSLAPEIAAVVSKGVTRNLCIRPIKKSALKDKHSKEETGLPSLEEPELNKLFHPFGVIEQVRIAPDVGCSFVSFADISSALQATDWARSSGKFPGYEINYGKDRCAAMTRHSHGDKEQHRSQYGHSYHDSVSSNDPLGSKSVLVEFLRRDLPLLTSSQYQISPIPLLSIQLGTSLQPTDSAYTGPGQESAHKTSHSSSTVDLGSHLGKVDDKV